MRRIPLYLLLFSIVSMLSAFTYDILKKLALAEKEANEYIFTNLRYGNLSFPRTDAIKQVAIGDRAGMVKELGDYIRRYTESVEFNEAYQEARSAAMPQSGKKDIETLLQDRITELERDIATTEEDLKKASSEMKKLYEVTLTEMKKEYTALKDPKNPKHNFYKSNLEDMASDKEDEAKNEAQRKETEKYFPANPKVLIKERLQEFLALTADIDFNAKLVKQGNVMKFADPKLEAKSVMWKRCFRSGKETITAARTYAQQWLKELK